MAEQSLNWAMPVEVSDQINPAWTLDRIAKARQSLANAVTPKGPLPATPLDVQTGLNTWWVDEGQFIPQYILDEIGVSGGQRIPQTVKDIKVEDENASKHLQEQLGIKYHDDPLALDIVPIEEPVEPSSFPEPKFPEAVDIIRSLSDDELEKTFQIMNKDVFSYPAEVVRTAVEERQIRDMEDMLLPYVADQPLLALWGTQFFNQLGGKLPEKLANQDQKIMLKAIGRIRQEAVSRDPTFYTKLGANSGAIAADLIKFALLPNPTKIALFSRLSPVAKTALNVGTKAGLIETLRASEEGENLNDRALEIAKATGVGALTGATLGILFKGAKSVFDKIKDLPVSKQADAILSQPGGAGGLNKQQVVSVLKHLKSTDPEQFKAAIEFKPRAKPVPSRVVPTPRQIPGARTGFAETGEPIEKVGKAAKALGKEVAKPKTAESLALEAAKALPTKAPKVKPREPRRIVSPEEAGPFKITFKGEKPQSRIIVDPKVREAVKVKEQEIANLRTRLDQAKADSHVDKARGITIEKAKAAKTLAKKIQEQIDKRIAAVDAEKLRSAVKLVNTRAQAALKLEKIRTATEYKQEMRSEALSMIQAIDKDLRPAFINRAFKADTLKKVQRLGDEIEAGIEKYDKRQRIKELSKTIKDIEKNNKFGKVRLGAIPSPQRESLINIIDSIDPVKLTEAKRQDLLSLQRHMQRIASQLAGDLSALDEETEQAVMLPPARQKELLRLSAQPAHEMTADEIGFVIDSIKELAQQAKLKKSLKIKGGFKPIDDSLKTIKANIVPTRSGAKKLAKLEAGEPAKEPTTLEKAKSVVNRATRINSMHMDTLIETASSLDNAEIREIFDFAPHEARRHEAETLVDWLDRSADRFRELGFRGTKQLRDEKHIVTLGRQKVELNLAHLIKLELKTRDPRNLKSMLNTKGWDIASSGVTIKYPPLPNPSVAGPQPGTMSRAERMKELSDIVQIVRNNPMAMGLADWTNELNPSQAEVINESLSPLLGHDIARDKFYTSNPKSRPRKTGPKFDPTALPPEQAGRYQRVVGGRDRLKLEEWDIDFLNGLESDANTRMAVALRNGRVILGSQSFQDAMKAAGREDELNAMITLWNRIQGISTSKTLFDVYTGKLRTGFTKSALGYRTSTMVLQSMSYPVFMTEIDPIYGRMVSVISPKYIDEMAKDSAILNLRWRNHRISVDIGAATSPDAFDLLFFGGPERKIPDSFAGLIAGDKQAFANGHKAVVREILGTKRNGKNIDPRDWNGADVADLIEIKDDLSGPDGYPSSENLRIAAARRTEYVGRRTQPDWDPLNLSVTQTDPSPIVRSVFLFRTALEAMQNAAMRVWNNFVKSNKTAEDYAKLAKGIGAIGVTAFSVAIWKKAYKWMREAGARKAKEAFGVYTHKQDLEFDKAIKTSTLEGAKNIVRLNKFGRFIVQAAEIAADKIAGEGYNWNRETFENPIIETLNAGGSAAINLVSLPFAVSDLKNIVADANTPEKQEFNKELVDNFVDTLTDAFKASYNFGSRTLGNPLIAPTQEFINPFLKKERISLLRELTFNQFDGDKKATQEYANRIFVLYEIRSRLKKQKTYPTDPEQQAIAILDRFAEISSSSANRLRNSEKLEDQKEILKNLEATMNKTEKTIINLGTQK